MRIKKIKVGKKEINEIEFEDNIEVDESIKNFKAIDIKNKKRRNKNNRRMEVGGDKVKYIKNWGEYFDSLFSKNTIIRYETEKMIKENKIPQLAEWYIYGLEKNGFNPAKFDLKFELPKSVRKWLKQPPQEKLGLTKLYYRYWFPLKAMNFNNTIDDFSPLSWIASAIYAYIQNDFDYLMMVNGLEGTGKSSLAINLAFRLKAMGLGFNLPTHIFFKSTPEDYIINMIENTERQVFIFDEARAHFWKRSSQTKAQKNRIMSLTMQRARNHVYLLCTRQPDDVDVDLRDSRVASVLYSIDKGEVAFLVNRNVGFSTKDPFGFNRLEKMFKYKQIKTPLQLRKEIVNLPSLYAYFRVAGLPDKIYLAYKELKMNLNKIGKINLQKISVDRIASVVLSDEKLSEEVAKRIGVDKDLLKIMVVG